MWSSNRADEHEREATLLKKSYYLTLDCRPAGAADDIRHAFRNLVRHYHPDIVGTNGIPFFQEIVEAYHVLSDSDRRKYYRRGLRDGGDGGGESRASMLDLVAPDTTTLPAALRYLRDIDVAWPSLETVRERLLRNFRRGEVPKYQHTDAIDIQLILTPGDAAAGGVTVIDFPAFYPCPSCKGAGQTEQLPCEICDETGLVAESGRLQVSIPAMVADHDQSEIPLPGLGVHNLYVRLHFRIAPL
jgi:molecular chaperone DnaJ